MEKRNKKSLFSFVMIFCLAIMSMFALTACNEHTHSLEHISAIDPTCTTEGNIEYWHCKECNKNFDKEQDGKEVEETKLAALGHNYEYTYDKEEKVYNGVCSRNETHTDTKPAGLNADFAFLAETEADLEEIVSDAEATTNVYIKLSNDIALTKTLHIKRNCVINLNEKTISLTSNVYAQRNAIRVGLDETKEINATLQNGNVNATFTFEQASAGNLMLVEYEGDLTLDRVNGNSNRFGIMISENANVKMNDSRIISYINTLCTNNTYTQDGMNVEINDSTLKSEFDAAIFLSAYVKLNILNNSNIIGNNAALHIMMGDVKIQNSILSSGQTSLNVRDTKARLIESGSLPNDMENADGAPIVIRADLYYDSKVKTNELSLTLENVTYNSSSNVNVLIYNCKDARNFKANAEDQTTLQNQFEYVQNFFANQEKVKVYELNGEAVTEVTEA